MGSSYYGRWHPPMYRGGVTYAEGDPDGHSCGAAFVRKRPCPREWGSDGTVVWAGGEPVARWAGPKTVLLDCSGSGGHRSNPRRRVIETVGAGAAERDLNVVCARFGVQPHSEDWEVDERYGSPYYEATVKWPRTHLVRGAPLRPATADRSKEVEREIDYMARFERVAGGGKPPGHEARIAALWEGQSEARRAWRAGQRKNKKWFKRFERAWCEWHGAVDSGRAHAPYYRGCWEWRNHFPVGLRARLNPYGSFRNFLAEEGIPEAPPHPAAYADQDLYSTAVSDAMRDLGGW